MRHKLSFSTVCDKGLIRQINQDSVYADSDGYNGIFCVADGMGGHSKGELASQTIISEIKKAWERFCVLDKKTPFREAFGLFEKALDDANSLIYESYNKESICGSTVSLLFVYDDCYGIINVGDSRIYISQKKQIVQVTEDDVWENLPEQNGIDKAVLVQSPKYGKLTNSVGTSERVFKKYSICQMQGKQSFLLCSDGLHKCCDDSLVNSIIIKNRNNPVRVTNNLSDEVYQMGAPDNFSIIYICV